MYLTHNAVIRIDHENLGGIFRIVADDYKYPYVYMVKLPEKNIETSSPGNIPQEIKPELIKVDRDTLESLEEENKLIQVSIEPETKLLQVEETLNEKELKIFKRRKLLMKPCLDPILLSESLYFNRGLGGLVKLIRNRMNCARSTIYRLWDLLCINGFGEKSLNPRFDLCGAPDIPRPIENGRAKAGRKTNSKRLGVVEENPQPGCTDSWRIKVLAADARIPKPKPLFPERYTRIISAFSTEYKTTSDGLEPVAPLLGTYPNRRQVRHMLKQMPSLRRILESTTKGHFNRNLRGLNGRSWQGVAGPGHTYAMDSTIGDVYLRSSVNRAWIIGRPIVYIIVDVWSTAIVGFYVCLTGPSWHTAKVALFSCFADPALVASLWGFEPLCSLYPFPGIPAKFLFDRGEYLSIGALQTAGELGFNADYAASYRPDWKGLVEVLHRIAKDKQYFFMPGAIDARRKELELRPDAKTSALTLRQYAQYLTWVFAQYNLHSNRDHRMDFSMIGAGVHASPAGLWRFGFDVGIGYRKEHSEARYISSLLPQKVGSVRRDGIFMDRLQYECNLAKEESWTTLAARLGHAELPMSYFPGSTDRIWTPNPNGVGLLQMNISDQARASGNICHDEWVDALVVQSLSKRDRDHAQLVSALGAMQNMSNLFENAKAETAAAEEAYEGPMLSTTQARTVELVSGKFATGDSQQPSLKSVSPLMPAYQEEAMQRDAIYSNLMKQVLGGLNK